MTALARDLLELRTSGPTTTSSGLWRPVKLHQVQPAPLELLLGDLLPIGQTTLLYGDGESGKSLLAQAIALSVASGKEIIPGWRPSRTGPVLVLDWETFDGDWHTRILKLARGAGVSFPEPIHYVRAPGPLGTGAEELKAVATKICPRLVIVDSVGFALAEEEPNADPRVATLELFRVIAGLGTTALVIDHVGKNGQLYGSRYKFNAAREVFKATKRKDGPVKLTHHKSNLRRRLLVTELVVQFSADDMDVVIARDPVDADRALARVERDRQPRGAGMSKRASTFAMLDGLPEAPNSLLVRTLGLKPATARKYKSEWKALQTSATPPS